MNDRLSALRLFVRVARTGSFSRAGRETGLSQSSASRIIKALERDLSVTLFRRTTRAVVLTEVGREYLERIVEILGRLDEADNAARGDGTLHGTLRLALPASVAMRFVVPILGGFLDAHPQLRVELIMADRRQDPVQESIDVAISFGLERDSPANARYIATNERVLVASPEYLARAGVPKTPDDLATHSIITGPVGRQAGAWSLGADGHTVTPTVRPRLTVSVNEAAIGAATAGLGILSTGYWGCRAELIDRRLVRVLPHWRLGTLDMYLVLPQGRASSKAARAFASYLVAKLRSTLATPIADHTSVSERRPSRTGSRR